MFFMYLVLQKEKAQLKFFCCKKPSAPDPFNEKFEKY